MCYFLSLGLAADRTASLEEAVPRELAVWPRPEPVLARLLPPDFVIYTLGCGGCSCGLYASSKHEEPIPHVSDRRRKQYERQGWSKARIERAVAQSMESQSRRPPQVPFRGLRPDVRHILATVTAEIGRLAILVHFDHKAERFAVTIGPTLTPQGLLDENWLLSEDEIVWIDAKLM